jgi:hypothetical protein
MEHGLLASGDVRSAAPATVVVDAVRDQRSVRKGIR